MKEHRRFAARIVVRSSGWALSRHASSHISGMRMSIQTGRMASIGRRVVEQSFRVRPTELERLWAETRGGRRRRSIQIEDTGASTSIRPRASVLRSLMNTRSGRLLPSEDIAQPAHALSVETLRAALDDYLSCPTLEGTAKDLNQCGPSVL
jgi:hypothetical protein